MDLCTTDTFGNVCFQISTIISTVFFTVWINKTKRGTIYFCLSWNLKINNINTCPDVLQQRKICQGQRWSWCAFHYHVSMLYVNNTCVVTEKRLNFVIVLGLCWQPHKSRRHDNNINQVQTTTSFYSTLVVATFHSLTFKLFFLYCSLFLVLLH